jgi:methionyl-tRNA formyltransferase
MNQISNNQTSSTKPTVVFLGSGPVAAASLDFLRKHFAIEAVITKPRPAHHKDPAPVEELAKLHELTLYFAANKSELDGVVNTAQFTSPIGIVIDFGLIISKTVIDMFPKGIINSHFSLLPQWRGADPITYSLLSGQTKTGVSIMLIDEGLDTGPLLAQADYDLDGTETSQTLTNGLVELSNQSLAHTVPLYLNNHINLVEQSQSCVTHSRKLTKADAKLDWNKPAAVLEREVRAFSEWPKSKCTLGVHDVIVTKARVRTDVQLPIGVTQITANKTILVGCKVNALEITELKPAGKQAMSAQGFINGYSIS